MKALDNNLNADAEILINLTVDFKTLNNEGLSALDYIFGRDLEQLKGALFRAVGSIGFENFVQIYSEDKLNEVRRMFQPSVEQLKMHDVDTLADTTMFSGMSEIFPLTDIPLKDEQLSQKIQDLHNKALEAQKRIEKLKRRNKELKVNLKTKINNQVTCVEKTKIEEDPMNTLISGLTSEIGCYNDWISEYRKTSRPFFKKVSEMMADHLTAFLGNNISVSESGSYENGLIMPWSDLNLVVTFPQDGRSEIKHRNSIIESTKRFSKVLKMDKGAVQNCIIEERSSLMILKIQLTKEFREQNVEIIFKYYVNPAYPSNEEIVNEYLERYSMARPLYIVFRTILHRAKLDDPSLNGLKSVVIFLMIVGYLQHMEMTGTKPLKAMSTGELFLNFLFFYSYGFDYYRDCIQCHPADEEPIQPFSPKDPRKKINSLMIVNPYNTDIILTKSFKRTAELKQLIRLSYVSLFSCCNCAITKSMTIKPKLALSSTIRNKLAVKAPWDEPMDRFKNITLKYYNQSIRKVAKKSLHLNPEAIKEATRASLAHVKPCLDDLFEDDLELYRPVITQGVPMYMLCGLFGYNFNHDVNI